MGAPVSLGVPEQVLLADPGPDGTPRVVSLLYRGGAARLDEFDGELEPYFFKQISTPDTQWVQIGPNDGLWIPTPHAVTYVDRQGIRHEETARLAGPTLMWQRGRVTYRLEGPYGREEAAAIAESVSG